MKTTGTWYKEIALCIMVLGSMFGSTGALAETEKEKELQQKVDMLESRIGQLEAVVNSIQAASPAPPTGGALPAEVEERLAKLEKTAKKIDGKSIMIPKWKDGLRLTSNDKQYEIKIGGRIHNDWMFAGEEDAIRNAIGELDDGVEFRRARLYLAGHIYKHFDFKMQYDFADGDADFKDVYMGIRDIPPWGGGLRFGQFKEPFSFEELTSSNYITFMERSLPNALVPGRSTGAMMYQSLCDDRMTWAAGVFRDSDDFGDRSEDEKGGSGEYNFTGRLTALPIYRNEGRTLLHLGGAISHRNPNDDMGRYRQRPEAHLTDRFIDTRTFGSDEVNLYGAEAALVCGPLSLQAEYIKADVELNDTAKGFPSGDDPEFDGYYVYLSYFLTGEHRRYKKTSGAFARVKPNKNFLEDGCGPGAVELAARYSYLDLSDGAIDGGELEDWTLGLNWYLNPNMRFMFNYVRAQVDRAALGLDGEETDIFQVRAQFDF